jgi:hypothetical protein
MHVHPHTLKQQSVDRSRGKYLYREPLVGGATQLSHPGVAGLLQRHE